MGSLGDAWKGHPLEFRYREFGEVIGHEMWRDVRRNWGMIVSPDLYFHACKALGESSVFVCGGLVECSWYCAPLPLVKRVASAMGLRREGDLEADWSGLAAQAMRPAFRVCAECRHVVPPWSAWQEPQWHCRAVHGSAGGRDPLTGGLKRVLCEDRNPDGKCSLWEAKEEEE